jgi:hypothetical protein
VEAELERGEEALIACTSSSNAFIKCLSGHTAVLGALRELTDPSLTPGEPVTEEKSHLSLARLSL